MGQRLERREPEEGRSCPWKLENLKRGFNVRGSIVELFGCNRAREELWASETERAGLDGTSELALACTEQTLEWSSGRR